MYNNSKAVTIDSSRHDLFYWEIFERNFSSKIKHILCYSKILGIEEKIIAIRNLQKNGQSIKEIAKQLCVSTSTIYNYMQRL